MMFVQRCIPRDESLFVQRCLLQQKFPRHTRHNGQNNKKTIGILGNPGIPREPVFKHGVVFCPSCFRHFLARGLVIF